jgi:hypothetical protein
MRLVTIGLLAAAQSAVASNVYIMSSGDSALDALVVSALQARGHTAIIGVQYSGFDGSQSLAGFQTVYLQANENWAAGDMPLAGQTVLLNFVASGGGLVTSEWSVWKAAANSGFALLGPAFPATSGAFFVSTATAQYTLGVPDPILDAGLPASFTFPQTNIAGTESVFAPATGATAYFHSVLNGAYEGAVGIAHGSGRVMSLSTVAGLDSLNDPNFRILLANACAWAAGGSCYANCDNSTTPPILNVLDFTCFLNKFAAGDPGANCDGSTIPPILNVLDFTCFLNRFAAGCP